MAGYEETYVDPDGQKIGIRESADHEPGAYLAPVTEFGIAVPAHRLAEFCGAVYRAAGQPVPDLPGIPDPALVEALAADLAGLAGSPTSQEHRRRAGVLLGAGWRKP